MELMTIPETAAMLRVSTVTVRRYIAARRLPAVRVGRGLRVRREDAESFPSRLPPELANAKPFTFDDPLWNIVGIAGEGDDSVHDVSENKHKYLAEAYYKKFHRDE